MIDLIALLPAFRDGTGTAAAVWLGDDARPPVRIASSVPALGILGWTPPLDDVPQQIVESPNGPVIVALVPGPRKAWVVAGPSRIAQAPLESYARVLRAIVGQYLQASLEVEHAANELAERYE